MQKAKRAFIILLGAWLLLTTLIVTVLSFGNPVSRAVISMGWGVICLWIIVCGGLMYRFRESIRRIVQKVPLPWHVTFVLFTTSLALLEETISTSMTNLAPVFGVKLGEAYITASANYFDVVLYHSVITLIGPFVCWALALKRYDFSPFSVFIVFGISGTLLEMLYGGAIHVFEFGLWIFVYGLMVFLPAYSIPSAERRGARPVKWHHHVLMVFMPALFIPLFSWIPNVIDANHPQPVHFPPMQGR